MPLRCNADTLPVGQQAKRRLAWFPLVIVILASLCAHCLIAKEVIPPPPAKHFTDNARVVSPEMASKLDKTLEDFERETSNQILVAIFSKMQSDSSIEDYTVRVAQAWRAGQKARNNGAVLFVFIQDRKMFLQVGYGLEGSLPDALAKQIIETEIKPRFKAGDFDGGLNAGVLAIMAATRGEYKGTGQLAGQHGQQRSTDSARFLLFAGLIVFLVLVSLFRRRTGFARRGYGLGYPGGWVLGSGGLWSGGGWGGRGGDHGVSGGGGGFSGGGGSFGGGGAGGSW